MSYQIGRAAGAMGYDEVHLFNGRVCHQRPFCDLLERSARVVRYEQGATGASYLQADKPIHHPETIADLIRAHDYSPEAGEAFYLERFRKEPGNIVHFFTAAQVEGQLPPGVEPGGFVAFFSSSSDEMMAISDDIGFGEFPTQSEAALAMARTARVSGKRLILRMHPHLQYKHDSWRREWDFDRLAAEGVLVIPPESSCDSYALAGAAHCVFTCGSTVGMECSFRGIPNADVGRWVGARLGAMSAVLNERDMAEFLAAPSLPAGAREAAMMYGSWVRRAGTPLPEYDIGLHPSYSRISGRIVDPVRYAMQRLKDAARGGRRETPWGMVGGKAILESNLEARAKAKGVVFRPGGEAS